MRPVVVLSLLLSGLPPASADITPEPARIGRAGAESLIAKVSRYAADKPVPVVLVEPPRFSQFRLRDQDVGNVQVADAMQSLARVFSHWDRDEEPPYWAPLEAVQIGAAWTIAPTNRLEAATSLDGRGLLDVLKPTQVMEWLVRSLSREQLEKATTKGLRATEMTDLQNDLWNGFLASSMFVMRRVPDEQGGFRYVPAKVPEGAFTPSTAALRIHTYFNLFECTYRDDLGRRLFTSTDFAQVLPLRFSPSRLGRLDNGNLATLPPKSVPLQFTEEPGLFAQDPFQRPSGIQGKCLLGEAVERIGRDTGAALTVDRRYSRWPAYVGDPALPAGTVLRALARSSHTTWRRVGKTWHLAPGGPPVAAARRHILEAEEPFHGQEREMNRTIGRLRWNEIIATLRPDPDIPLGPTPAQAALFARRDDLNTRPGIPFAQLTKEQKAAVRLHAPRIWDSRAQADIPVPEAWLREGVVTDMDIRVSVDISGFGRAVCPWAVASLAQARYDEPSAPEPAEPVARKSLPPMTITEETRGLAPPPLPTAEWPRLLGEMKDRGLNTLYLPVLWNGHTLFPSAHFPLLPGQGSPDPLADILRLAGEKDIQVIAVLHTLAWRFPDAAPDHWLSAHEDWVDRDALGRTRREWARTHPAPRVEKANFIELPSDPLDRSDFVNPRVPEVRTKLLSLAEELKHYPSLSGVALAHWSRNAGPMDVSAPPDQGYQPEERALFIRANGLDPLDLVPGPAYSSYLWNSGDQPSPQLVKAWDQHRLMSDQLLLAHLQAAFSGTGTVQVVSRRPETTTPDSRAASPPPAADILIHSGSLTGMGQAVTFRHLQVEAADTGLSGEDRLYRLTSRLVNLRHPSYGGALTGAVLDFSGAPDLLWEGLKLIRSRKEIATTPGPY